MPETLLRSTGSGETAETAEIVLPLDLRRTTLSLNFLMLWSGS